MKLIAGAMMVGTASAGLFGGNYMKYAAMNGQFAGNNVLPFIIGDDMDTQEQIPYILASQGSQNPMLPLMFDEDFRNDDLFDLAQFGAFTGYPGSTGMTQRVLPFLTGDFQDEDELVPFMMTGAIDADSPYMTDYVLDQRNGDLTHRDYYMLNSFQGRPTTFGNAYLQQQFFDDADKVMTKKDLSLLKAGTGGFASIASDPRLFADFVNDKNDEAISKTDYLVDSVALSGGSLAGHLPYLIDDDELDTDDLEVPLLVNAMAAGGRPSLSQHLIPVLQMTNRDVDYENIMPWVMTQGTSYLPQTGNANPFTLEDVTSESFLPWLAAGEAAPVHSANPFTTAAPVRSYGNRAYGYGNRFGRSYGFGRNYGWNNRAYGNYGYGNRYGLGARRFVAPAVEEVAEEAAVVEP